VIKRHHHLPVERHLSVTSEVLIVRQGKAIADIYDDQKELVASREVQTGDMMVLLGGGHGFRVVEPTVFLEIKQGPYMGVKDKVLF
jgi:mannose-6-phosphate isomerase-like protein (cupin superfamily)